MLSALIPAVGWALLHFVWQGLLIGWGASVALSLLRGARPQVRYAVACGALLLCAALPLSTIAMRLADGTLAHAAWPGMAIAGGGAVATDSIPLIAIGGPAQVLADPDWRISVEYAVRRQLPWIVVLWSCGAALMALRLAIGLQWVRELSAPGHYQASPEWQARLLRLAQRFDLNVEVCLGVAERLDSPITAGCWKPIVLVPASLLSGMPAELLEALLAHELAHIKRHDYLVNLIQSGIEVFLFYHPSVWMLSRRIRVEREQIADDLAASVLGEPRRLALALSELDRIQYATPHLAHAAHGGNLMSRIKHLLRPDVEPIGWKMALPLVGLCAASLVLYAQAAVQAEPASPPEPPAPPAVTVMAEPAPPAVPPAPAPAARTARPALPALAAAPAVPAVPALAAPPAPPAPPAPVASVPPVPPVPPLPAKPSRRILKGERGQQAYALVQGRDNMTMSGASNSSDWQGLSKLRARVKGDFLWYRDGDKAYLIQDPALLAKASEAWTPANQLGAQMDEQGKLMDAHGKVMDALGRKMDALARESEHGAAAQELRKQERAIEKLGRQQEAIGRRMERVGMQMGRDQTDAQREASQRQMDQLHAEMDALQPQMQQLQRDLAENARKIQPPQEPMQALSRQMSDASKPMAELGQRMGELGRQQEQASRKAEQAMRALIQEAIQSGKAVPAPAG